MKRNGSVLMEFLLVFPIIFLLVLSLLQFAQIWIARQITAYAAYCAARATLCSNSNPDDDKTWAENAVKTACSWMCLAGLSTDDAEELEEMAHDSLNWNKYHDLTDEVADDDKIYRDVSAPRTGEQNIPGWGSVPGSSSRRSRVTVTPLTDVGEFATGVRVEFKFPLIFPLAGRIISWAANHPGSEPSTYDHETGTWEGDSYYSIHTGWHDGKEVVMDDGGNLVDRSFATYGEDGKYPVITLTETCILPCPYKRTKFKRKEDERPPYEKY